MVRLLLCLRKRELMFTLLIMRRPLADARRKGGAVSNNLAMQPLVAKF